MNNLRVHGRQWAAAAIIAAAAAGFYSNTLTAPFVYDDLGAIVNNTDLQRFDFTRLDNYFGVRALPQLTLALNWRWGGEATIGYHAVNLVLHVLSALVLWRLAWWLLDRSSKAVPLFAALLFAVHPIQTEAVTYITQRITLMAAFFYLAALWAYARWRIIPPNPPLSQPSRHASAGEARGAIARAGWATLSLIATFAAMNSKEIAFTLPLAIVWLEYCIFDQKSSGRRFIKLIPWLLLMLYIPWQLFGSTAAPPANQPAANSAPAATATQVIVNAPAGQANALPRLSYLYTQFSVFLSYLRLLVWPAGQNIDHDPPVYDTLLAGRPTFAEASPFAKATGDKPVGRPAAGLALLLVLAASAWRMRRRFPLLAFGVGLFLLTWSLESTFYPLVELMVEYRLYLPMAGAALAAGALLAALLRQVSHEQLTARQDGGQAVLGIVGVLILFLAMLTLNRNGLWRDPVLLWQDAAAKSPHKARPVHNLGSLYLEAGQYSLAQHYFERAVGLEPAQAVAHANLGTALLHQRKLAEAEAHYRTAMQLEPGLAAIAGNLAQLYIQQGRWDEAHTLLEDALARDPRRPEMHNALGIVLVQRGDLAQARAHFEAALELDPSFTAARRNVELLLN